MGTLPRHSLVPELPFSSVQIDLCGPFKTKTKRVYIMLYVCMFSKALAVELVENYSSQAAVIALKKHFSRRNLPHTIYSDRGTQLVKARDLIYADYNKVSDKGMSQAQVNTFETNFPQITWRLIPPGAAHRVGTVESMVKLVKRSLRYISVNHISVFEFDLVIQNIASIINNRPLGFIASSEEILCPNQLLLGRSFSDTLPPEVKEAGEIIKMNNYGKELVKSWFA